MNQGASIVNGHVHLTFDGQVPKVIVVCTIGRGSLYNYMVIDNDLSKKLALVRNVAMSRR